VRKALKALMATHNVSADCMFDRLGPVDNQHGRMKAAETATNDAICSDSLS
jgi:hypothetical protein